MCVCGYVGVCVGLCVCLCVCLGVCGWVCVHMFVSVCEYEFVSNCLSVYGWVVLFVRLL